WTDHGMKWDLDQLGNQTKIDRWWRPSSGGGSGGWATWHEHEHNAANEITSRKTIGNRSKHNLIQDNFSSASALWSAPDSSDSFSITSGEMRITGVSKDS